MTKSILLVDDDEDLSELIVELLHFEGRQVEVVGDGAAADELLKQKDFELILLDWDLPGLSGPEVCKNYRARGGTGKVVLMTGMELAVVEKTFSEAGAWGFLLKPFNLEHFTATVRKALGG